MGACSSSLHFQHFPTSLDFILFPPLRLRESGVFAQLLLLLVEAKLARPEASRMLLWSAFRQKATGQMVEGAGAGAGGVLTQPSMEARDREGGRLRLQTEF